MTRDQREVRDHRWAITTLARHRLERTQEGSFGNRRCLRGGSGWNIDDDVSRERSCCRRGGVSKVGNPVRTRPETDDRDCAIVTPLRRGQNGRGIHSAVETDTVDCVAQPPAQLSANAVGHLAVRVFYRDEN
ncbi:unannotated protein [freshwater metagenome]|uniref:Unannotated protein n=1 Tax=freshwater metagenome TaxID=449393 RepID=A0A6J7CQE1_9ZZZZ